MLEEFGGMMMFNEMGKTGGAGLEGESEVSTFVLAV